MVVVHRVYFDPRATNSSLSPVLRGDGQGEGTDAPIGEVRPPADRCPLTLPSPLSTGQRVLSFRRVRFSARGSSIDRFSRTLKRTLRGFRFVRHVMLRYSEASGHLRGTARCFGVARHDNSSSDCTWPVMEMPKRICAQLRVSIAIAICTLVFNSLCFARALAPVPLPYSFHDSQGMQWDIMPDGTIGPGNADVFDSGARLIIGGSFQYSGSTPQCQYDAARNEIILPSQTLAELSVSRR